MKNKKNFMDYERPSVTADVVLFKMGVKGAAWATVIAQTVSCFIILI